MFAFSRFSSNVAKITATILSVLVLFTQGSGEILADNSRTGLSLRGAKNSILSIYSHSFYDPTVKVHSAGTIKKKAKYTMHLAKNETEYCQIAIRSRQFRSRSFVELGEFKNEDGDVLPASLYYEYEVQAYDDIHFNTFPDPILPLKNNRFEYASLKETNMVFAIIVKSDKNTKPGKYTATIKYGNRDTNGDKYENSTATVTAEVWNFTLNDAPAMESAFQIWEPNLSPIFNIEKGTEEWTELYIKYYEMLLEHNVSPFALPYDILDPKADAYMSDPRLKNFMIPYSSDDEVIKAYYRKLSSNPEWFKKAYFYPVDEPHTNEQIQQYEQICERLSVLFPGYHMVTPFFTNVVEGNERTNLEIQSGKSDILCPETVLYNEEGFGEKIAARVSQGDRSWWYVCNGPNANTGMCNLFVQLDGIKHRVLFWQQYDYDVTGLLYWSVSYYYQSEEKLGLWKENPGMGVWRSALTAPWTGSNTYGDGLLIYPGVKDLKLSVQFIADYTFEENIPVSSLRLEAVANGVEDYEYLKMAEELLGKKYVDKMVKKITKSLDNYTYSDSTFAKVRNELGNAIEKAINK